MKIPVRACAAAVMCLAAPASWPADPLPSWNDTAPKKAIVQFVRTVTDKNSPDFVPREKRIATFDNDGTLWAEQPMYFQAFFIADRVKRLAPQHPDWKTQEPFASLLKGDLKGVAAGGGIEFMRPWVEQTYGIPPEQVVGSSGGLQYELRGGKPVIVKLPNIVLNDDKEGKPVGIQRHIGRRPIAAFGNSDGDLQMLQWTCLADGTRLCLYVHHTDAAREWAYDRDSHIGKLDKGLDEAKARGWTIVDMKNDWKEVFASP
jgi:hypothetical protein